VLCATEKTRAAQRCAASGRRRDRLGRQRYRDVLNLDRDGDDIGGVVTGPNGPPRSDGYSDGPPRPLFRASLAGNPADARDLYAAAADGSKFLVDGPIEEATDRPITVIVDWAAGVGATEPATLLSRPTR
jgi:hypothetical protein